jgi:hypothetical protein
MIAPEYYLSMKESLQLSNHPARRNQKIIISQQCEAA